MKRRNPETTSKKIEADTTPIRAAASTGMSHALRRPHGRLLLLTPLRFFPLIGGILGLVVLLVGAAIYVMSGHAGGLFVGGIGAVFAGAFFLIALLTRRFEFDQAAKSMSVRRFGSSRRYPIEVVRAVQLIQGGWHGSGNQPKFFTYQLNVVLDDPDRPRLNLTNTANWEATWRMGSELAEFLGVPLLDEVSKV
jgi:hypothetical protein